MRIGLREFPRLRVRFLNILYFTVRFSSEDCLWVIGKMSLMYWMDLFVLRERLHKYYCQQIISKWKLISRRFFYWCSDLAYLWKYFHHEYSFDIAHPWMKNFEWDDEIFVFISWIKVFLCNIFQMFDNWYS